jgi:DNA-binding CsgD family transcriptional regulator
LRFDDADLVAFARHLEGCALLYDGRLDEGLPLIEAAMFAVLTDELKPVITGIIYCNAIASCQRVHAYDRTREWTAGLDAWCEARPQLALFKGQCLVHRAEIRQLRGEWDGALTEAESAAERCTGPIDVEIAGRAHYLQGEIHRLRGDAAAADACYRNASRCGIEPQPGAALLRLAQGDRQSAASTLRRVMAAATDRLERVRLLPAHAELMLAVGDFEEARAACRELDLAAASYNTDALAAIAWGAYASLQVAEGNARMALDPARRAFEVWQGLGAVHEAARMRLLLARACIALGDFDGARLELDSARAALLAVGARPGVAETDALLAHLNGDAKAPGRSHPLTERELQVLRLVASGKTNKAIARELMLSGKTIDRHLSNIFAKLDLSSRAAATAYVYEHRLL